MILFLRLSSYQHLIITREIKDRLGEGNALGNLGIAYYSLGNYPKALEYHHQRLAITREIKDRKGEGKALGNLGIAYRAIGDYFKALENHEQHLVIAREIKDRLGEGQSLSNLGIVYYSLGDYPKAIEYHEQSLGIDRETKNKLGEGQSLGNLGNVYQALSNYPKAIEYHEQRLAVAREIKDKLGEGNGLGNLGIAYYSIGNYLKAIEYHEQSLGIDREIKNRSGEGNSLGNLGNAYQALNNFPKAIEYYAQDLVIARELKDIHGEYSTLNNLGATLRQKEPELSIILYKQAVQMSERIRVENQNLSKDLQSTYTQIVAKTYRSLADLLLKQNRTIEALQVLDLLKAKDLQDFLKDSKGTDRPRQTIELFPEEQAILTAFNQSTDLNQLIKSPTIQTQTQSLKTAAADRNLQLNIYRDLQTRVNKLGKNVALFYPLILDDRLELVILTNDRPPIRKPIAIPRAQLQQEITDFRKQLENRNPLIQKTAQTLYQRFIQPIEPELKTAGVDTIVYAPDDIMRYVPLAALHDGKQWLAEKYQINYLTALALTPLDPDPNRNRNPQVLAAALTEERKVKVLDTTHTFDALLFTQPEIENLAKILPTTQLLNQTFNRPNLTQNLPNSTIVHLATHGLFVPNSPDQSFIVLGDGNTISLREIGQQWKFPNASLVVLSACETAIGGKLGNGIEVLGFGYQMQRAGSRASISSLWKINDGGTQSFMNQFYNTLKQNQTPAAAIQQTQKQFIQGKIAIETVDLIRASGSRRAPAGSIPSDTTHPYYWAPFILVGNGL